MSTDRMLAIAKIAFGFAVRFTYMMWVDELYKKKHITEEQKFKYWEKPSAFAMDILNGVFIDNKEVTEQWAEYEMAN